MDGITFLKHLMHYMPLPVVMVSSLTQSGAKGLLAMRNAGAKTIGQDEMSCVVYGMPKVAFELGAVERQLPLHKIADGIVESLS